MGRKINHGKAAELILAGATYKDALTLGGFSPKQARKGIAIVRKNKKLQEALVKLGRETGPEVRAALARGRAVLNVVEGVDRAPASIKLIGQDRELGMWEPDNQANAIVMQLSPQMEANILALLKSREEAEE